MSETAETAEAAGPPARVGWEGALRFDWDVWIAAEATSGHELRRWIVPVAMSAGCAAVGFAEVEAYDAEHARRVVRAERAAGRPPRATVWRPWPADPWLVRAVPALALEAADAPAPP